MNTRRTALIGINAAACIGLLISTTADLSGVPSEEHITAGLPAAPSITGAISKPVYAPAGRILFDPVQQADAKPVAEPAKPPFRLVGIVSRSDESFAVVQPDGRPSVQMRLNDQVQGWRLDDLRRTSARFASKERSIELDLTSSD